MSRRKIFTITFYAACAVGLVVFISVLAQDKPLSDAETFAEVSAYLQRETAKIQESGLTGKEYAVAVGELLIPAGKKLLEVAQNSMEKGTAYNFHVVALIIQADAGIEGASEKMDALLEEYAASSDPIARQIAASYQFRQFGDKAKRAEASPENYARFFTDLKTWIEQRRAPLAAAVELGIDVAKRHNVPMEQFIDELTQYIQSDQYSASAAGKEKDLQTVEGTRLLALGSDPKIFGRTIDDEEFDWASLRKEGEEKYVLVKFTATWCGPCQQEIPGLIRAHEKYKDKGFEIVSIYVMQPEFDPVATVKNAVAEKKIPWIVLSEELSIRAGHPNMRDHYALQGVPKMVLVDKEGKIIMPEARGHFLQMKLAEIFP